ncbi:MAG: hypothetical protein QXP73_06915, partial [Candidatus Methanomethylicaceae archaeon]
EVIYPQPFGKVTAGSEKDYPVDFSHFNIQGSCVGAVGVDPDPDKAVFSAVDVSTEIGPEGRKIKMKVPFFTGALGSTEIARDNWEGAAAGAASCHLWCCPCLWGKRLWHGPRSGVQERKSCKIS